MSTCEHALCFKKYNIIELTFSFEHFEESGNGQSLYDSRRFSSNAIEQILISGCWFIPG